jgi:hypothetical protein
VLSSTLAMVRAALCALRNAVTAATRSRDWLARVGWWFGSCLTERGLLQATASARTTTVLSTSMYVPWAPHEVGPGVV